MNLTQINKQIEKLQEQKNKLLSEQEANKDKLTFKRYKVLPKLKVSNIIKWTKPYDEIIVPRGCRLIKQWELFKLLEEDYEIADEFLGDYKGKYNLFWTEQSRFAKSYNYTSGLYLGGGLYLSSGNEDLAYSDVGGRVVFVKEVKNE